jgi:SNF2 family DNA or RNA helicase
MAGAGLLAGERVRRAATGEDGVVLSAGDGVLVQVAFSSGTVWIHREELEKLPEGPAERLAAAELGQLEPYGLRLQSLYLRHAYRYDPLTGLSSARIEPQLHQVFVAHRVTQKLQPRMILADEVGLGKTIEAALIIKELRAKELLGRVLIIVPASLQLQWQSELKSKFNEDFEILDGAALRYLGRGKANPWMTRQNVICGTSRRKDRRSKPKGPRRANAFHPPGPRAWTRQDAATTPSHCSKRGQARPPGSSNR